MDDCKSLWKAIARQPGEDTPKLALADWYDDHGQPDMAFALRWCVAKGKWPYRSRYSKLAGGSWWPRKSQPCPYNLDRWLMRAVEPSGYACLCGSAEQAVKRLAVGLARLRATLAVAD